MKIKCILKREGGSFIELGGTEYHFEPVADGAFVAEVTDEAHIDRLLSIPEAYKVYHGDETPKGEPKVIGEATAVPAPQGDDIKDRAPLSGSDLLPPQFEIGERVVTQLEVVKIAFEASGMSSDEWNELGEDERTAKIEIALDEMAEETDGDDEADGEETPETPKTPEAPEAPAPAAKKTTKKTTKK